jgi:protein phosphatase
MLNIEFAQASDCGRVRDHNEDYLGHFAPASAGETRNRGWLFALADGVGGQDKGEVASRMAVDTVVGGFRQARPDDSHFTLLPRLVQKANARIFEAGLATRPGSTPMATTLVACAVRADRAVISHVGDSRCYLVRFGRAEAVTRDHTVAAEQFRMGLLSGLEASAASSRNVLSRSLGMALVANVETTERQVIPGDSLLMCSDGLHGSVTPADIGAIITRKVSLQDAVRELVELANQRDGSDNVSVLLIHVSHVERVGMYRGRPYKLA